MISSSDDPKQGSKSRKPAFDTTEGGGPLTGARRRLGRLIDLDERVLIDLQLEVEARERGLH